MATLFGMFPFLQKLFADGGYQGPELSTALAKVRPHLNVEIVKRSDRAKGFVVLSKRWIVEQMFAGSIAAEGWTRIGRSAIGERLRSCTSPQFGSCLENFVIRPKVSGQMVKIRSERKTDSAHIVVSAEWANTTHASEAYQAFSSMLLQRDPF